MLYLNLKNVIHIFRLIARFNPALWGFALKTLSYCYNKKAAFFFFLTTLSEKLDETVKPNQAVKNHLAESSRTNLAENLAQNSFVGLTENLEISTWRRVKFAPGHYIFIYSAFFDDRIRPNVIRLNVLAPLRYIKTHGRTRCLVETRDGEISSTFGQLEILREQFSLPWASHYVLCDTANKNVIAFDLLCVLSTNFLLV